MPSKSRSETARANGAKSKGPKTATGKAASARNTLKHGTAQTVVMEGEFLSLYDELRDAYSEQFQPANQMELDLVEVLASTRVRLRRITKIESGLFTIQQLLDSKKYLDKHNFQDKGMIMAHVFERCLPSITLLTRYENSLNRTFDRTLKQLQGLQKARLAAPPQKLQSEPKQTPAAPASTPSGLDPDPSELASGVRRLASATPTGLDLGPPLL